MSGTPGSDYMPVAAVATPAADTEPDLYRVFSYAVLAQHRRICMGGVDVCTCGSSWADCEVTRLAHELLTGGG
ncbi:MAG: hypothetical protein ACRDPT_01860 [Streptomycetales bacterium]